MADQATGAPVGVKTWLSGFVYRGRAPWEGVPCDYHVEVGQYVEIAGIAPVQLPTLVLAPDAAAAVGYALPDALAEINAAALAEVNALRESAAELTAQNVQLAGALARAEGEATQAGLAAKQAAETIAAMTAEIAALRAAASDETESGASGS